MENKVNILRIILSDLTYIIKKLIKLNYIRLDTCDFFVEIGSKTGKNVFERDKGREYKSSIIIYKDRELKPFEKFVILKLLNIIDFICNTIGRLRRKNEELKIVYKFPEILNVFSMNVSIDKMLNIISRELSQIMKLISCKIVFSYKDNKFFGSYGERFEYNGKMHSLSHRIKVDRERGILAGVWESDGSSTSTEIFLCFPSLPNSKKLEEFTPIFETIIHTMHVFLVEYMGRISMEKLTDNLIKLMIASLEAKDPFTKGHSIGVAHYAQRIAEKLGFDVERVEKIRIASLLHDIGKIAIDESTLKKPTFLSNIEYEEIKKHPEWSYKIISQIESFKDIATWTRFHHERIDGSGYPFGLKGDEIPVEAQIISISDAIESMIAGRPYSERKSRKDIIEEIKKLSGKHWREDIAKVAIDILKEEEENVKDYLSKNT